jgi:RNA polymerase sigma-70 factor, ECF subfamily
MTSPRKTQPRPATDFDSVYSDYYPAIARSAFLLLGNSGEAEEVTQEAFAALLQNWDTVDRPAAFVRTAMVNRAHDVARRRVTRFKLIDRMRAQRTDSAEPEFLLDVLGDLDYDLRALVVLRFYLDLTVPQIAEELRLPEGTIKSRLHRATKELQRRMGR